MLRRIFVSFFAILIFSAVMPGAARALDCSEEATLKSTQAGPATELSFRNQSTERRRLYWIESDGRRRFYGIIEPGNVLRQPSYADHAWVVTDEAEKCLFVVVAMPTPMLVDVGGPAGLAVNPPVGGQQPIAQTPPAGQVSTQQIPAGAPAGEISPVDQFHLVGAYRIVPRIDDSRSLNIQADGQPELVSVRPQWSSPNWMFEAVPGTPFVWINNLWKGTFLKDDNGRLSVTTVDEDDITAQWTFQVVEGRQSIRFVNRASGRTLAVDRGVPVLVEGLRDASISDWQLRPVTGANVSPVVAPSLMVAPQVRDPSLPLWYATRRAYELALENCRLIGGYWTGSSCLISPNARPDQCPRGWFWVPEIRACLYAGNPEPIIIRVPGPGFPPGSGPRLICPPGQVLAPGPQGRQICFQPQTAQPAGCPVGSTGTPPNCQPIAQAACPPGQVGTPPNCRVPAVATCPAGQVGTPPNCRVPAAATCPPGQTGTPPNCQAAAPATCPAGQVGSPPNCRTPIVTCPPGQVGVPPNCRVPAAATCPPGQIGTPPNCKAPAPVNCPPGQVGTPPNCRVAAPATCPAGQVGTPPNCHAPAPILQTPLKTPLGCPPGKTGTPPNCK